MTWLAPASSGGAVITQYTVTASSDSHTVSVDGALRVATVTGLTNGTSYTFTVVATNFKGDSPTSLPSNSVTPATVPAAPTGVTATRGNALAAVSWIAPISDGGNALTGYTITSAPGNVTTNASAGSTSIDVTGLLNGTSYTFTVVAKNSVGSSAASVASNAAVPATVPDAPTGVSATAGDGEAGVSWVAPTSTGGSAITSYTVTSTPNDITVNAAAGSTTINVPGLTNGVSYTFKIVAKNAIGNSAASLASTAVIPSAITVPSAPTNAVATIGNGQASVLWTASGSNGGSAITGYTVTSLPGNVQASVSGTSTRATVTGLTNGTPYTFTVLASMLRGTAQRRPHRTA